MFTIPLYDDNPTRRPAIVVWLLIGACVLVFVWQAGLPAGGEAVVYSLGVIPAVLFGSAELPPEMQLVPGWATVLTSMFLHGGWMHLIGNMLYLWIFGNNVEDSMGRIRFLVFYVVCGTAAALAQSLAAPESTIPMIGASGAIGGVLGAYLMLHPRANVRVLFVFIVFVRLINVPAVLVLGLWFVMQLISGATTPTDGGGVAFWAHVGGFVAGMILVPLFKERGVALLQGPHSRPFAVETPSRHRAPAAPPSGVVERRRRGPWG